ncbi:PIN domain-containing protein [Candidatus Woesearchaeota archaeon]|nr:PIN domain-containing protein [Candidatus Woesearchaeota archaeon]
MIGLDTSAIIDIFKGNEEIKKFLQDNKEPFAVTIMNYLELFFGLNPEDQKHKIEEQYYEDFFNNLFFINLSTNSCKEASKIYWNLKKEGKTIDKVDCIIASLFSTNGIKKILTRNVKHFERIKQLSVINY